MRTAVVLFTRDLRVHDNPALSEACDAADLVVPLFVFDDTILGSRYAAPNRVSHLVEALRDLRSTLRARGGELVVRRGDPIAHVRDLVVTSGADTVHVQADISAYATRREAALRSLASELTGEGHDLDVRLHDGALLVPPGELAPTGSDHFKVFTPYWRHWVEAPRPTPRPAPAHVTTPASLAAGELPTVGDLLGEDAAAAVAPRLQPAGETAARARADAWFAGGISDYDTGREMLAGDGTSRLSADLHLGAISVADLVERVDRRRSGHEAFLRQLCWRDFNQQLLAARPDLPRVDIRGRDDVWRSDDEALAAWKAGRTGYPVVDAGMRQLLHEGWMHNRARMIVASFLTKHLYLDWREGAWHFMDHLVDGDLANNFGQWQWTAGTGTDSRPNRMFNPVAQGQRYDPDGVYVRRHVPELVDVPTADIHTPWETDGSLLSVGRDYPPPIVDHRRARARFLAARG